MSEKVKETVSEEAQRVKLLATDAARSGAYLYPLKGIAYFISHRSLWQPLVSKLAPSVGLGVSVTAFMFVATYIPQAAVLSLVNGPFAAITTILLVLNESSTLFTMLSKSFLIQDALVDTFDGVMVSKNMTTVVSEGRQIKPGGNPIARLGKTFKQPLEKFTPKGLIRYLMYLPLNFIPVVGTVIFLTLQGKRAGPNAHSRYFQLKQYSKSERSQFIEQRQAAYTRYVDVTSKIANMRKGNLTCVSCLLSFGIVAVLLELIPIASIFFSFTNTVGAALWAADIERENTTAPHLREQAKRAE
ncbi:MAG: hypothetical protein M1819_003745 [Sarea resinae]|nr:MAG: hypothetical protein M1819_003745 [Sarea resinae]